VVVLAIADHIPLCGRLSCLSSVWTTESVT